MTTAGFLTQGHRPFWMNFAGHGCVRARVRQAWSALAAARKRRNKALPTAEAIQPKKNTCAMPSQELDTSWTAAGEAKQLDCAPSFDGKRRKDPQRCGQRLRDDGTGRRETRLGRRPAAGFDGVAHQTGRRARGPDGRRCHGDGRNCDDATGRVAAIDTMSFNPIELRGKRRTTVRHPRMAAKHEYRARVSCCFADTLRGKAG